MKSIILRENLKEGLSVVERVAVKSISLPILNNILITTAKNILELSATDLEMGIRYRILAKNEGEGGVVVPAKFLSSFIGLLSDPQITLEGKEKILVVDSKNHHTEIKALNLDDFPIIPTTQNEENAIEVSAQAFCQGIGQVVGVTSQSQTRPEITGVYISFGKSAVKIVATDSFRLAERTLQLGRENGSEHTFILPQKTAREIVAVLGDKPGKMKIYISPNQVTFRYEGEDSPSQLHIEIVSRVIDGEYPNYQEVIPKQTETKATMDKNELINQIRAASIFANKMQELRFSLDPKSKKAELVSQNTDLGSHSSSLQIEGDGEKTAASFNWRFFLEGVSQVRTDRIEIGMNGEEGASVIKAAGGNEGYLYVLMPIKA
ncbi:MAG TPA: DNA polymerase III subunit beta [Candidatus Wildermuthbacteria bacterium]|nr:DNA polymerase III subunit beta [Candidatus Wildermuthbacteria bacterium]